ncbi:E3 ubiquitin-protein ligase FANCL isoform X3 [Takifugu flavidus]|uniref:E3 ubiquitin-protein ligase FANCL isoform X3 n=1 Tax=Takifugu flavidus TaxID=433684 RepID=UPI002544AB67|nr:E3 ubiquitin-protein ligase FANCL isoform X3 [Takifugu flavidus]
MDVKAMEASMIKDNPVLLPLNKEKTIYDGFITVQERDFRVRITLPPDRKITGGRLHCCWQLKHLLRGYEQTVKQRLQQSDNLVTFILELKTILEVGLKSFPEHQSIPPPQYYSQLISEMETLGWSKLLFIDTAFQTLQLNAEDSSGRQHLLTVKLKPKHPAEAPDCSADLPLPLLINWTPQTTLDQLYGQFLLVLESLTRFWDVLDEIDRNTWILEPEKPCRSDTMRRIAIGNNVSIKVEVDPRHPEMLPDCCLLGAEHVVTPLRNKLNTNMHLWLICMWLISVSEGAVCGLLAGTRSPTSCTTSRMFWRSNSHHLPPTKNLASALSVGSVTRIVWKIPSLTRCVMTPAVASLFTRPACTSGFEGFPPAGRASVSFLEIVLTAASQSL